MTAGALLNPEAFHNIPDKPAIPSKMSGDIVILVFHEEGEVLSTPGHEVPKSPSLFVSADGLTKAGPRVRYTIDLTTASGVVVLIHPDSDIVQLELNFFTIKNPVLDETK
ncbi:hypothetical protein FRACYDRAFT_251889 [Fragilariopsis cylindrus CCMP1102]|uniref:Uncharacterized protein n=1 Tax=Fragilariopsis cylindrus CCMP1102 TaxID=635003 RepID=A0A1E7EMR5_9STRA|nr:hypothetical protein FRACYDRAFT_251889 [Fragilariopsis cylindrus CCMP1102]|eukprot:OEU07124.1 hypothetical protein FRACYDRAFT_251889 [Fragilariopsis cylindrus CCMP1102]